MRRFNPDWFDLYSGWLEYSVKKDKAYCLGCYLFRDYLENKSGSDTFATKGFDTWKNPQSLREHVGLVNSFHNNALKRADCLMRQGQSIVHAFYKQDDIVKGEYRIRLNASIDCCRYLVRQGLTFRGHDESVDSANRGNFLELVKYTAGQNEVVSKVVLENAPKNNQMVCPKIQRDIVHCFVEEVIRSIIQEVDHDVFCLMVDESADIFDKEQMVVVFRFVDKHATVKERFIGLIHVKETFSAFLKCAIDSLFAKHGLSIKQIRGQDYDGASNMKGEFNGLRYLILRENSSAYYIHCFAHQLQLVVVAVAKKHFEIGDFFDMISVLINVVEASCKRKDRVRDEFRKKLEEGINQVDLFSFIIKMLEWIEDDGTDSTKRRQANVALQRKDQDILNAMSLVKSTKQHLFNLRDDGWDSFLNEVFLLEYNDCFDEVNTELLGCVASLSPTDLFREFDQLKVMRLAEFYPQDFTRVDWRSLEHQLGLYIDNIREDDRFANLKSLGDLARVMIETRKHLSHPQVYRLLKVVLTLPIATATVERCFSATVVKTTLRNRISDQFLNDYVVCLVKRELFDTVINKVVIKRFQSMENRMIAL
ncbi:TTF-type zinc finger protein with HAT dimerization domain-containing protein [Arabidopsis thaliana]|uniref:TTF-type zinc finger protein with HAT dimerization domain-containing protein n=1 Tax=Arabidopsis thaliana TaxID=3702 RepID=F4IJB0_ARATH|nr:TTF-type zinc finger protein with HAT dimerization domain-containing protein [Arabidopsis thaliana]AEC06013.1 TTF-type zinc finger protein with HAT dimerization domain-containing protein [Arabidopsis thaliana]|eukprot:NP_001154499.1 TTF-type zinc finger protein with HAT dimerization domain-containing protein [Arabidopsis thaliana]